MPKSITKEDAEARYKEWLERKSEEEETHKARIARYAMREKSVKELRAWLKERGLERHDLLLMYHDMAPRRADEPVKSKKPLHPVAKGKRGSPLFGTGKAPRKGDRAFSAAIREARLAKNLTLAEAATLIGVSLGAVQNWESGRNVVSAANRVSALRAYGLPLDIGEEASEKMETERKAGAGNRYNGATDAP